jgi:hypothetical protein
MRVLVLLAVLLSATPAWAGRTHYGWLYGTEINPERGVELETWMGEEDGKGDAGTQETFLWWGPTVGLSPHLEAAFPIEAGYEDDGMGNAGTELTRLGAELRWRVQSPDPIEAGPLTTLVRAGVKRLVQARGAVRGEADVVVAYEKAKLHAEIDLGTIGEVGDGLRNLEFRPGGGAVYQVARELRLGAEVYSELRVHGDAISWVAAGPTVSWSRGRFWMSATFAIGLYQIRAAPRANLAIAF